ncbi:DNA-binding GntR family transcriptional regulator [Asanoa ferruginea]|uniref:DNA-binding GntR family transcriptional regulator n=1 Tax=Asanoa ferruginea TaxID=53367 RepID=A0A3D9ZE18_9ACTN|nr:GntR family transcriptional regulator [Asanoa ferruginea]REF94702.1 DNA-binding GntR family transcriptional regulator [Asanoa ferruginea]GIF45720.1 GntR family transcriptional regulator [Asanoa ferruginea]
MLMPVLRSRGRASDEVYAALATAIRDLRLTPGATLSETDLAEQLGVSRTPLREAIARLADAGLVQVVPQVGTKVALIGMSDVEEARFVRENLEVAAFAGACGSNDVSRLRRLLDQQRVAVRARDLDEFFAADEALHEQIFVMSGHPGAWQAVVRMKVQLDRLRRLSLPDPRTLRDLLAEHRAIVDALDRGDVAGGSELVRAHARRAAAQAPALRHDQPDYFTD